MACVIQRVPREILIMIIELVIEDLADSTKQRQEAVYDLFTPHDERSAILQRSVVWKALLHDVSGYRSIGRIWNELFIDQIYQRPVLTTLKDMKTMRRVIQRTPRALGAINEVWILQDEFETRQENVFNRLLFDLSNPQAQSLAKIVIVGKFALGLEDLAMLPRQIEKIHINQDIGYRNLQLTSSVLQAPRLKEFVIKLGHRAKDGISEVENFKFPTQVTLLTHLTLNQLNLDSDRLVPFCQSQTNLQQIDISLCRGISSIGYAQAIKFENHKKIEQVTFKECLDTALLLRSDKWHLCDELRLHANTLKNLELHTTICRRLVDYAHYGELRRFTCVNLGYKTCDGGGRVEFDQSDNMTMPRLEYPYVFMWNGEKLDEEDYPQ